jgi:hypothetical protein
MAHRAGMVMNTSRTPAGGADGIPILRPMPR